MLFLWSTQASKFVQSNLISQKQIYLGKHVFPLLAYQWIKSSIKQSVVGERKIIPFDWFWNIFQDLTKTRSLENPETLTRRDFPEAPVNFPRKRILSSSCDRTETFSLRFMKREVHRHLC